jgi:hypothetical protein
MRYVAAVGLPLLALAVAFSARRRRRAADTIGRYSRAVSALRTITAETRPAAARLHTVEPGEGRGATIHALHEVGARSDGRRSARAAGRVRRRIDPDRVARRPVVAHLPSISAPRSGGHDTRTG